MARWTRAVPLRKWGQASANPLLCDLVLVPINMPGHWVLGVVDLRGSGVGGRALRGAAMACGAPCHAAAVASDDDTDAGLRAWGWLTSAPRAHPDCPACRGGAEGSVPTEPRRPWIGFFDSMGSRRRDVVEALASWVSAEAAAQGLCPPRGGSDSPLAAKDSDDAAADGAAFADLAGPAGWTAVMPGASGVPQQDNANDCGVFVLAMIDALSLGLGGGRLISGAGEDDKDGTSTRPPAALFPPCVRAGRCNRWRQRVAMCLLADSADVDEDQDDG